MHPLVVRFLFPVGQFSLSDNTTVKQKLSVLSIKKRELHQLFLCDFLLALASIHSFFFLFLNALAVYCLGFLSYKQICGFTILISSN